MKKPELYNKSANLLIDAWMSGKLEHGDCTACAVGNICGGNGAWAVKFSTNASMRSQTPGLFVPSEIDRVIGHGLPLYVSDLHEEEKMTAFAYADKVISDTSYTEKELAKIEWAFEMSIASDYEKLYKTPEGQYIGLCAVLDVLHEIHEVEEAPHRSRLDQVATGKGVDIANLQNA